MYLPWLCQVYPTNYRSQNYPPFGGVVGTRMTRLWEYIYTDDVQKADTEWTLAAVGSLAGFYQSTWKSKVFVTP